MLTACLFIMFCLQFIMSGSEHSDYGSRNDDSATTECYTDPDGVSDTSSHGTEQDFLEQFKCSICDEHPSYEECIQLAPRWAAGECPPVSIIQPEPPSPPICILFCASCRGFFHTYCVISQGNLHELMLCARVAIATLEANIADNVFTCASCLDQDGAPNGNWLNHSVF